MTQLIQNVFRIDNMFLMKQSYTFLFDLNVRKSFYDIISKSLLWCCTSFHVKNKNIYKNRKGMEEWKNNEFRAYVIKSAKYGKCTNVTNAINMTSKTYVTKLYRH